MEKAAADHLQVASILIYPKQVLRPNPSESIPDYSSIHGVEVKVSNRDRIISYENDDKYLVLFYFIKLNFLGTESTTRVRLQSILKLAYIKGTEHNTSILIGTKFNNLLPDFHLGVADSF